MLIVPPVLGAFALAAAAIVLSPGPDTMLILRAALGAGRRRWPRTMMLWRPDAETVGLPLSDF